MAHLVPGHDDTQPFNPKQDDFANIAAIAEAALNSCDSIEQYDSQVSDDGGYYHLPLGDEQGWTNVNVTKSRQPDKNDPGPSVRCRTPAEVRAIIETQVEDREYCLNYSTDNVHSLT